jgi:hypothetical protein
MAVLPLTSIGWEDSLAADRRRPSARWRIFERRARAVKYLLKERNPADQPSGAAALRFERRPAKKCSAGGRLTLHVSYVRNRSPGIRIIFRPRNATSEPDLKGRRKA